MTTSLPVSSASASAAAIWALLTDIVPLAEASRTMGLANIATAGASAVARLLGALLIDPIGRWTGSLSAGYTSVFIFGALLVFISALVISRLPEVGDETAG